jgi:hypothetical protein
MTQDAQKKTVVFRPSPESLKHFKDASAESKLNWLEEANRFVRDFVSPEKLKRWKNISGR